MMMDEPDNVIPESVFEDALVRAIHNILNGAGSRYSIVPKFGLDIGVFISNENGLYTRFLEVKSYGGARPGGIGFGDGLGRGPQVHILLCPEGDFDVINDAVRWVLADATLEKGSARYALFDCRLARAAADGGSIPRKAK